MAEESTTTTEPEPIGAAQGGGARQDSGMTEPIKDPYAGAAAPPAAPGNTRIFQLAGVALTAAALGAGAAVLTTRLTAPASEPAPVVRPTPTIVTAIRDLARLETAEVHVEKVVDLTDRQSRFFGLVQAEDALLLVAAGRATLGVDLSKVGESDISLDPETGVARMVLPEPELFSARLDEQSTYVYTRTTDLFARRNEALEARARQEAIRAIERAAVDGDALPRARAQAERQLTALATHLGAKRAEILWRAGSAPTQR